MIAVLIWILLGALVFMCGGVYLVLCPDEPDTNGGLEVYEDEDYFSDMLTDLAFGVDDEEAYPHELEPVAGSLVASVPDLEPLPAEEDFTGQFEFDLDKLERSNLYVDDDTYMADWQADLDAWKAEQAAATAQWRAEMGLDCE